MPGTGHRAPADKAQDAQNQRHGGEVQRAHCRCAQDSPIQQPRGHAADLAALCGPVQPPVAPVSIGQQDAYAGHEAVVPGAAGSVS